MATQTFFKDFDVIQLQFKDEDMSISTVAVVNDPENSTGGVQGPTTSPDADLVIDQLRKEWSIMLQDMGAVFKWIFAGILLCALIPLLIKGVELLADILTEGGKNTTHTRPKGRRRGSTRRKNK